MTGASIADIGTQAAKVILAAAVFVAAVAFLTLVVRRGFEGLKFVGWGVRAELTAVQRRLDDVTAKADEIHAAATVAAVEATATNLAVNNVPKTEPRLVENAAATVRLATWSADSLELLAHQLDVQLAPRPDKEPTT